DLRDIGRDQLGLEVSQSGRPATFDRERVSRDPTTWTSLATYGHPRLDDELRRIEQSERDGSPDALVVAEVEGGVAAAYHADRTPPEPIRRVVEVRDLGAPSALGEAE